MARSRITGQTQPRSAIDWERLMRKAIERAEKTKDNRLTSLKMALSQGKAQVILRKLGIIGESDLDREFPARAT